MLQNDYLVAKIGVDTAENEPRIASDVPWQMRRLFCQREYVFFSGAVGSARRGYRSARRLAALFSSPFVTAINRR